MDSLQTVFFPVTASSVKLPWFPNPADLLPSFALSEDEPWTHEVLQRGHDPSAKGVAAPKRITWLSKSPIPGRNKMGRSEKETFSELLALLASGVYLVWKSVKMLHTESSSVPVFESLNSCLVTYLLRISYSLGKSGLRMFGSRVQLDFHVGGDQRGILSVQL